MKNVILKFEHDELDEFIVSDYTSKKIDLHNIFNEVMQEFLTVYKMQNNDKLERISYELYGTTDYWDILCLINDKTPFFETSFDYDILETDANDYAQFYKNFVYSGFFFTSNQESYISGKKLKENNALNENNRFIYVIKPEKISYFISMLKNRGYL